MIKGLYAAASAMIAGATRQEVLSHNAANMETPGFKQALISLDDFLHTPVVYPPGNRSGAGSLEFIGYHGLGVEATPETTDFSQGPLRETGEVLDLAIEGPGFFRLQTPDGERYSRDGRFLRNTAGQLANVDGYLVLGTTGQPIQIPEGSISIGQDGTITVNNQAAGRIGLAAFTDPETELTRDLPNAYAAAGAPTSQAVGNIQQGYLEYSNVNTAQLMGQMVSVARAYEAAQRMVQVQDELLGRSISQLGRL